MAISNPPTIFTGGRRAIDYKALYILWKNDPNYLPIETFLEMYGIDPLKRRVKEATREWRRAENTSHLNNTDECTWNKIRKWRTQQAEQDYLAADAIRQLVLNKVEDIKKSHRIKTKEIATLSVCLERIQRIQRLSLGLSTDNVGIDDGQQAKEQTEEVFIVEMNENGKFKTQRPRLVQNETT